MRVAKKIHLIFVTLFVLSTTTFADTVINIPVNTHTLDGNRDYYTELLKLALEHTATTHGAYKIRHMEIQSERERLRKLLLNGELDILWSSSTPEREKTFLPIYSEINKGLTGYRVLLINKRNRKVFEKVNTLVTLQQLTAGSGLHWSGTKLLKLNNISVVTAASHESLFKMLAKNRFDYLMRNIQEISSTNDLIDWFGLERELEIFDKLLVYHAIPYYFFVAPDNHKVAERIEVGISRAKSDGSFDRVFNSFNANQNAFQLLNRAGIKVIELKSFYEREYLN